MNVWQQLVNGVIMGHAYALTAIGWTLLLGAARLVNFGHGQMYMLGAFMAWWVMHATGLPYVAAIPAAVLTGALLGAVMQRAMMRLTVQQNLVSLMIVTLGFGQIVEGTAGLAFGVRPQMIASPLNAWTLQWGPVLLTAQDIAVVVVTIIMFLVLRAVMAHGLIGSWVRMVAEDPRLTQLAGVNISKIYLGIFAFEGAAVALAATLVAPRTPIITSMGFDEVIMTFVVVVLGGVGSVSGSYFAGLAMGLFSAFFGALVGPTYVTAAAFLIIIPIMVLRPGGLASAGGLSR
ncbi:branched-chain amino acid ABC transporter permease [Rhodopila sp.]|jgi:branched-chain amino acid transport system permease protein|uniref:branched-chain amino acid ABC transporter permease n=1 Tax=Rhodopila sp. TaxID=2480087 RepID=UPI002C92975E|nr:branched-chain amino acid ABC transporter permease [Rhodopila sp.]HVZ06284.1 branched-chain amino acid ABC transporter permease [Rhodopila sp.]